uniref:Helicase ATP-binding domain-containing protein n=1 Tax=viral metagenome TaxID=1070528 RepID=A0A6C0KB42_9ZZZZ
MEKQIELVDHERILGSTYRVLRETMLPEDVEALGRELTIRTEANAHSLSAPKEVRLMELEDDWVAVPRFFGLQRFGEPDVDVTVRGERRVDSMVFSGSLDASRMQPECASKVAERLDDGGGGTLVMPCGMGKTCVALHCACRFAVRTLVVVPTTVLATQWVDRITFFCPRATAVCMNGAQRLQDTEQYAGCDFVVTTIQTLSLCTIPEPIMQLFGLTIVDEAHGFCAPTFSTAARKIFSARILALSATPERKDGLHEGMPHLLGTIIHRIERPASATTGVRVRRLSYSNPSAREISFERNGQKKVLVAKMITQLASDARRTAAIATTLRSLVAEGRTVLVLSERLCLLEALHSELPEEVCGLLCGRTKPLDRPVVSQRQVILATYGLCREGFDKPSLNTLVMVTPVTNVEQSVGRILRSNAPTKPPLVVDVVDTHSVFFAYAKKRLRYYRAQPGFVVEDVPSKMFCGNK